ncbi:hypothetical protein JX265_013143 [Neoarthrinium moseri]|uniref:SCP domain-containing protein n=1 Tax=Neoarthrinium moseri TaxID=1658444 RepID=A0A9P9W9D0_9PEZI|nr:uncharacterized protein JN550_006426 [Neoarthrinium moseri]KAI1849129.1 hypothetical protein JX266_005090 [Neoarthrinium moseri]KAI1852172.1 hypothetical protein JX265_013143 [Neoarthrinium moseri]KAI1868510.1 hypothetical protein JN550_006426 [Neoarthrinium moseri]
MADNVAETCVPTPLAHGEQDKAIHESASVASVEEFSVSAAAALNGDQAKALKIHNDGRKTKGCPALTWDAGLAQHAQQWANHLAQIDKMEHSSGNQRPGEGENLAWYSNSPNDPLSGGAQMWMNEAKDYHGEPIGQGNFGKYGHYTQCMWKSTTKLGMASARSAKGGTYIVGRYSPPGNWTGQKPY